jgi:CheY-like chemotaxis protein
MKYNVYGTILQNFVVVIEANSEEEALEKAQSGDYDQNEFELQDSEINEIEFASEITEE